MARVYLLATLRDITETIVLQSQLKLEEQKNQQRMATLYQIIHIQPAVLEQFILNTGAELEKINSSLKANEQDYAGIIKVVYQSIMTIKENVVSLGLEELGRILLYLEDYLETLKNKPVEWQDLLNLTLRVSTVQNEINNLKALFVKLGNYQVKLKEMGENQSELLLNPLKKILEESGKKLGKEIRLNTDNFDANLIDKDYRSVVKDVLIHLVQNAITHGIETPEQRQAFKKEAAGNIYLSCLKENGKLQILFKDDGQGLNPEEIRSKIRLSEAFKEIDLDSLSPSKVISLIFHPDFSTTKKTDSQAVRGTTGMYAVKAQIEQQGGSLAIRTMPGKSCEFRITLPG
jgi:two-component system chemotaxis sensor kinase CheA